MNRWASQILSCDESVQYYIDLSIQYYAVVLLQDSIRTEKQDTWVKTFQEHLQTMPTKEAAGRPEGVSRNRRYPKPPAFVCTCHLMLCRFSGVLHIHTSPLSLSRLGRESRPITPTFGVKDPSYVPRRQCCLTGDSPWWACNDLRHWCTSGARLHSRLNRLCSN